MYSLVQHELHMNEVDYDIWIAYGTDAPVYVVTHDDVPIVSVYKPTVTSAAGGAGEPGRDRQERQGAKTPEEEREGRWHPREPTPSLFWRRGVLAFLAISRPVPPHRPRCAAHHAPGAAHRPWCAADHAP